jgi:endonuclease/exonuclease/phosphatase family metal-dependent hydrolase
MGLEGSPIAGTERHHSETQKELRGSHMPWTRIPFLFLLIFLLLVNCPQSPRRRGLITYMPELECTDQKIDPNASSVRLVTYNIHHGAGIDERVDLARVASTLTATNADIIFLTEVDSHWRRSGYADQAAELATMLKLPYMAFAPAVVRREGSGTALYGNALLSRFPIEWAERKLLPTSPLQEPRVVLSAVVRLADDISLRIIGTHLGLSHADRLAQAAILREMGMAYETDLRVLMGDLNAVPDSPELQILLGTSEEGDHSPRWADPMQGSKAPATFPAYAPRNRIDFILVPENLSAKVTVYTSPFSDASDHLPVLAELSLAEGGSHQQ